MSKTATVYAPNEVHATPGVSGGKTGLQKDQLATRACIGRCTVDIVPTGVNRALALVGMGVGTAPVSVVVDAVAVAVVLALASSVDGRTVWRTQAWPLACRAGGDNFERGEGRP